MGRRFLVLVLMIASVPVLSHSHGVATPPSNPPSKTEAATEAEALAAARQSNARVAVTSQRTETQEVYANPSGTFTLEQHTLPIRVRQGANWVPVDSTLRVRPDGSVRPNATTVPIAFSGGGTGPLARISSGGREVALGWPVPLPAPVLSGDTATYPNVLPDVDLVVTADTMGFSEVLVVKTPAAAGHPDLRRLRLGLRATGGLSMRVDAAGNIDAVDSNGESLFHAGTPMMWDSSGGAGRRGFADDKAPLRHKAMRTTATADALTIEPDEAMLADTTINYPLYLDPSVRWTGGRLAWTSVWKAHPTSAYFNSSDIARVGHENDTGMTNRSFFRMNTSTVRGKHIIGATFRTFETHAWSCSARQVEVWRTGAISSSTTWNTQPAWSAKLQTLNVAKGYSTSCPDATVDFNVTAGVVTAAASNWADLTLGLRATSETDTFAWKKFQNNPTLIIDYNSVPSVPNTLSIDPGLPCVTGAGRPIVGTRTPTLRAKLSDVDTGQLVGGRFEWWVTGGAKISEAVTAKIASGSMHAVTIPANVLAIGGTYSWRVRGEDGTDVSAFTGFCEMTIDPYPPVNFPAVTSASYPASPGPAPIYRGAVGISGSFTLSPGAGDTDIAGYVYGLEQYPPQTSIAASGTGKTATVTLTPTNEGLNTLFVQSRDGVGNLGPIFGYQFYVRTASMPSGHWPLDETSGTTAADVSGTGQPATLAGGVSWAGGRLKGGAQFSGANGAAASTASPVLRTDMSFAVSAWVRLTSTFAHYAVVTQDGTRNSGFLLRYEGDIDRWGFGMYTTDSDTEVLHRAVSTAPPRYHVWTHLLGVYDHTAGQLRLYVDGVLVGTAAHTAPWNATGGLQIGRSKWRGFVSDWWQGGIDDVRAYQSVPPAETIAELAHPPAVLVGHWRLDETTGTVAADSSGAGRTATLSAGCSWTPGWFGGSLSADGACDAAVGNPVVRTDQSFTVSAWLRFTGATEFTLYTAVSQDGTANSGFLLQYMTGENVWGFSMPTVDSTSDTYVTARSASPVALDVWTHVAGVYDATTGLLKIYVDGLLSGIVAHSNTWHAAGSLEIGRAKWHGFLGDWWRGGIDDVRVFQGALTDDEVYLLTVQ
ncbi:MAG TPA: LamG-like jellyroll fold domain-containing protein [Candidatus Limnocylindrales bacterium]|nr:LamG-like jellyroll fold domain-containing protein [Candidatus Limnocylindrales bacterium]